MARGKSRSVLFLCTGNYYRSRFAEVLFNSVALRMGLPWRATSRGLALERGVNNVGPMAVSAVQALEAMGVRAPTETGRMPTALTAPELEAADWIVALQDAEHRPLLDERYPGWAEKIEFWDVADDLAALPPIEREVNDLVARLLGGGRKRQPRPPEPPASTTPDPPKKLGTARVGRETKGRKGKGVTTVSDLPLDEAGLNDLAATLKSRCGTGGTVKEGRIEIQGDLRDRVSAELEKLGYRVKRVGG